MRAIRHALAIFVILCAVVVTGGAQAAPYAAFVMDARNGEVIFARNHDTRLHPASLTKMMTLYVAFEAIKHGEVTLDTQFTVSQRAAGTSCVCLGLRPGQRISLRYLLRAAALRSANDASVVIAEGISGSVEAFAERMTRTARAMGMSNTTFRNPHGLTQAGHVSTARDMSILGRQLYFDYPQYFNMFSRRSDDAGVAVVPNTNRRFLDAYQGADGIKTGFTRAAGFNLTASAKRGNKHIIATMFGGTTAAARNAHVAELMDIGFSRAPNRVATRAPRTPGYQGRGAVAVAAAPSRGDVNANAAVAESGGSAKTIRLQMAVRKSPRPLPRPVRTPPEELLIALRDSVDTTVAAIAATVPEVTGTAPEELPVTPPPRETAAIAAPEADDAAQLADAVAAGFRLADPAELDAAAQDSPGEPALEIAAAAREKATETMSELARIAPPQRPEMLSRAQAETSVSTDDEARDLAAGTELALLEALPEQAVQAASAPEDARADDRGATPDPAESDLQTAARDLPEEEMIWIGAADTLAGAASGTEAQVASVATDTPPAFDAGGTVLTQVQPASLSPSAEPAPAATAAPTPAPAPAPAAAPGIILTSSASPATVTVQGERAAPDVAERQAIAAVVEAHVETGQRVVSLSTSDGGRLWGVSLGQFQSRAAAERSLITVKMAEASALGNGVSRIRQTGGRFEASFAGLTQSEAERACLRLAARAMDCVIAHP